MRKLIVMSLLVMLGIAGNVASIAPVKAAAYVAASGAGKSAGIADGMVSQVRAPRVYFHLYIGPRYAPYPFYGYSPFYGYPRTYRRCVYSSRLRRLVCRYYRRW
jgi:hypothetical protein